MVRDQRAGVSGRWDAGDGVVEVLLDRELAASLISAL
jgi:hypothetical protein